MISSIGSSIQMSFCRVYPYNRCRDSSSIQRLSRPMQYVMGQQCVLQPRLVHRILFSNKFFSNKTEVIVAEEDGGVPKSDAVASRRRRPLRISSVPSRSIGRSDPLWNANMRKFRAFVQRKFPTTEGQAPRRIQPKDFPKDVSLYKWLYRVRAEYQKKLRGQKNRLTEQRMEQLRKLGFQFIETSYRNSWDALFRQLCKYLKEHDGRYPHEADIATLSKEHMNLYKWCNRQRVLYKVYRNQQTKKKKMKEKRIKLLNSINFVWSLVESQWDERYEELKQYNKEHGTTMVPARYVGNYTLARWVETQRRQYALRKQNKASKLTEEKIQLLNELDFVWDPLEVRWMEQYNKLVEYQRLNGQYEMPTNVSDRSLRRWVLLQRQHYRKWKTGDTSKLSARRKELLDQLGMDWTPPPKTTHNRGKSRKLDRSPEFDKG
jgi:Helicase associated domain